MKERGKETVKRDRGKGGERERERFKRVKKRREKRGMDTQVGGMEGEREEEREEERNTVGVVSQASSVKRPYTVHLTYEWSLLSRWTLPTCPPFRLFPPQISRHLSVVDW